jgi:hypothetical protein
MESFERHYLHSLLTALSTQNRKTLKLTQINENKGGILSLNIGGMSVP